jgi:hypothetical protein
MGGLVTSARGKISACQMGSRKHKSPLALTVELLDPVKACRGQNKFWCSLPYGPQTRLTREHMEKEVTM